MIESMITSSVLILAILAIRFLCKDKISRRLQYALWLLVGIRLLLPFSIPAPTSVMNAMDTAAAEQFITGKTMEVQPTKDLLDGVPGAQLETDAKPSSALSLPTTLRMLWAMGTAVVGLWFAAVNLTFFAKLRKSRRKLESQNSRLPIYIADSLPSPCLFGLFHPAIYVTEQAALKRRTLNHVITHELCHYTHLDHIWSVVRCLCVAIHWYNPLVWIAATCSRFDCELACDESAISRLGEAEKLAYGRTLLALVSAKPSPSSLLSAATTMTSGGKRMEERILRIAKSTRTRIVALVVVLATVCLLVGCTFTGASQALSPNEAADRLAESIQWKDSYISFVIPKEYTKPQDWNILVSGSVKAGDSSMSVHLFEQENENRSWQAGKEYTIALEGQMYEDLHMDVYMHADESVEKTIDLLALKQDVTPDKIPIYNTVSITFPAYQDGRNENNAAIYDIAPFILSVSMPDGWTVRLPEEGDRSFVTPATPVDVYKGELYIGSIAYNTFTLYEGDDIPAKQFYQTVYYDLRLGSMRSLDQYTPVKTSDAGETGIATMQYKNPEEIDKHPGAMPDVPAIEVSGILSYDRSMKVYIAFQFAEDVVTDEEVMAIAESVRLSAAKSE